MALTSGVTHINSFIKIASDGDFCYTCAKKYCNEHPGANMNEAINHLKGKIANQPVMYERTSGLDKLFCFNCLTDITKEMEAYLPNKQIDNNSKENK